MVGSGEELLIEVYRNFVADVSVHFETPVEAVAAANLAGSPNFHAARSYSSRYANAGLSSNAETQNLEDHAMVPGKTC